MSQGFASNRKGTVSTVNSTTTPLLAAATFTGTGVDVSVYPSVVVAALTDQAGTLYIEFSPDNTNWDSSLSFTVTASVNEVHRITVTRQYFRVRFTNGAVNQTYFRLQALLGSQPSLTSALNSTVQSDADALVTRSVLMGETDSGAFKFVPVTTEGHLEVAIHSPTLPFGSVHTESLTPVFQSDAVYGLNTGQVSSGSTLSGAASASDSNFTVSSGTTIYAQAFIQSVKRMRYRAGQGVVGRFAGSFTTPVSYSYQVAGFGHSEDGVYFGYREILGAAASFGILYVNRGRRCIYTLTVSTGATSSNNATITLNGVAFTVPLTNASNIQRTVYEISKFGAYTGWSAYPASSTTVVFVSDDAAAKAGAFTFGAGATGAAASFALTRAGLAATETFIPQASWNGDVMDGTGSVSNLSGVLLDPTKGNVFQIGIQYLGYGSLSFQIETTSANNNSVFTTVHTIKLPNTLTTTSFRNPCFPFTMAVYSAGSVTNLTVKVGSFGGFIEGQKYLHGNRATYSNTITTVGASNYQCLFTIYNGGVFGSIPSQVVVNILSVTAALKHTSPCLIYLIKGGVLAGNPSFTFGAANSNVLVDTVATTLTYSTNDQILWIGTLGDTGEVDHHFGGTGATNMEELTLQPYEWVTLCAKAATGTPAYVSGALTTREDQ